MAKYTFLYLFFILMTLETLNAKQIVDCRVSTGDITECNPYGKKLYHAKKVIYDVDRQKLIISKTLPLPQKKVMRVISVADMSEQYKKIEKPLEPKSEEVNASLVYINQNTKISKVKYKKQSYALYTIKKGDSLHKIARKFGIKTKILSGLNGIGLQKILKISQRIKLPFLINSKKDISKAIYIVEKGDTLLSIARKFSLSPKTLVMHNHIKNATVVREGKLLKLPLKAIAKPIPSTKKVKKVKSKKLNLYKFGKHHLRVTATAYTSHGNQTDKTPFLAAWNNHIRPGMKIIAVSRDMLTRYGMRNGTKVRIGGLKGYYRVRDKMNKRYRKRIDIYMGMNLKKARHWGRRSVVIYW